MKVEVIAILPDKTILIKQLNEEKLPEPGKEYFIHFEKAEPDPVPEFNR